VVDVQGLPAVTVGVVLRSRPDDIGRWLADGAAFEAAGAAALWVESGVDGVLDPLILTAALAAVTSRSLLVATVPELHRPSQSLVRTLETVGRLSRGRLRVFADTALADVVDDHAAIVGEFAVWRRTPANADAFEDLHDPVEPQRWLTVASPESRSAWRATILDAAERGHSQLMVPANPRLLDILRNPEEPGDRHDLQLAQG
jgi:hypothetical protein